MPGCQTRRASTSCWSSDPQRQAVYSAKRHIMSIDFCTHHAVRMPSGVSAALILDQATFAGLSGTTLPCSSSAITSSRSAHF